MVKRIKRGATHRTNGTVMGERRRDNFFAPFLIERLAVVTVHKLRYDG